MQAKAYTGSTKTDKTNGVNRYDDYCFKPGHFFGSIRRVHNNWVINNNV
jgi:hypothetical protein